MKDTTSLSDQAADYFSGHRTGDRDALERLVRLLTPTLWHLARSCGLDVAAAEDAVQHAWSRLVTHGDTIREPQTVLAWLGTTVRREAWRLARESARDRSQETLPELPDTSPGPQEQVETDEVSRVLWRHFRTLTPRCQALLRVICRGGPPDYAALAEALGMPVGSIGPTRGRCLSQLRALLVADPAWSAT